MKLYLAAPYAARDLVREHVAPAFLVRGHRLTSAWLQASRAITPQALGTAAAHTDAEVMYHAGKDLEEVAAADVLVHLSASYLTTQWPHLDSPAHRLHTGGRHVETGYALGLNKSVIVVGAPENIFMRGLCHQAPTLFHAMDLLAEMHELADEPECSHDPACTRP